ncbi:MAG: hypothetical protein BWX88_02687 [Planctomycetes bacterium ADurb.Bin126]|nr:MAG: hypothetical protein BWX88_02687 [Planctomycetes bacterium ADurb.Bin126]HOD79961.1 hypothetical protein [Phycisphaerae bacterium]HQL74018.1 hypothetical protein [Phycisphaerae bacterium]
MKRLSQFKLPILLSVAIVACMALLLAIEPAGSATIVGGAQSAKAGTGGTTAGTFVKLSSAGTIVTATAVTDSVVGIAEITASANAATRYAPLGTLTTVTSGEAISVGDLLTAGTSGYAYVLDTDDASTQRVGALALTAASGSGEDVTVIVCAAVSEQRLTLGGNVTISSTYTFTTGSGAVTLAGDVTISGSKTFTTGTGAVGLNGDVTVAAGKDISLAAGAGYIEANGTTTGGIRIDPIDSGTSMTILANSAAAAQATVSLPGLTSKIVFAPAGGTTVAADVLAIPVTHSYVAKTTGADGEALTLANGLPGQLLTIALVTDGGGDGTLTPTTKSGFATIVFADAGDNVTLLYVDDTVGWVIVGAAGVAAAPVITTS